MFFLTVDWLGILSAGITVIGAVVCVFFGSALTLLSTYLLRKWEVEKFQSKAQLRSELATRRLNSCIEWMRLFDQLSVACNFNSFGIGVLNFAATDNPEGTPAERQRPVARKALQDYYDFVQREYVLFGPEMLKAHFWFKTSLESLRTWADIGDGKRARMGGVAAELFADAQHRFTVAVERVLGDGEIRLLKPDEITKINKEAIESLDASIKKATN